MNFPSVRFLLPVVFFAAAGAVQAGADTITFDTLPSPGPAGYTAAVPNGFGGLQYSNFDYFDPTIAFVAPGYSAGVVSPPYIAFNGGGFPAHFNSTSPFTLESIYMTSASPANLQVLVEGFVGSTLTYSQTVTLQATGPTLETFNFAGVTEVDFSDSSYIQFVLDNLVVTFGTNFAGIEGLSPNQYAVASNLDLNGSPGPALASVITALQNLSPTALPEAFSQLSPQAFGQFASSTAFNNASFDTQAMDAYLAGQRGADGNFLAGNGDIDASGLTVADPSYDPNLAMVHSRLLAWNPAPTHGVISDVANPALGGIDMQAEQNPSSLGPRGAGRPWNVAVRGSVVLAEGSSDQSPDRFDGHTESVVLSADYRLTPHFLVGLTAGYGHTDASLDYNGSSATVDSYSPGLYASYADSGWYADLSGEYIRNAYTQDRAIAFLGQTASSATHGDEGVANLDGGYDFHRGALTFGPVAGLQYTHLAVDGYGESGSAADLNVDAQQADSLRSRFGGRVSYSFTRAGVVFTPHLEAAWQHEFMDQSRGITSQFNGGVGSFAVQTSNPSRESALIDAGLEARITDMVSLLLDYQAQAGQDNYFGQSVQGGAKFAF